MKLFRSIRWRLQVWYGLLFLAVLAALGVTAFSFDRTRRLRAVDDELLRREALVAAGIPRPGPPAGGPGPNPGPVNEDARNQSRPRGRGGFFGRPRNYIIGETVPAGPIVAGGFYYVEWIDRDSTVFRASAGAPAGASARRPTDGGTALRTEGGFREVAFSPLPDHAFVIGQPVLVETIELRRLAWVLAASGSGLFILAVLGGWWITGRALQPIDHITGAALRISGGNLGERIDTQDAESELGQLASVLNATFARLETAFAQQAEFTADAAHELRTPVTVILTHAQNTLASATLVEADRVAIEACERAAQRMRRLIESLLKLARLDAGQEPIPQEKVALDKVVSESVELVAPLALASGLTLSLNLQPVNTMGSAALLAQVVTNLLANAMQHHGDKPGVISIHTGTVGQQAFVIVTDDGPGIPAEHLPRLFKRFYRVEKSRSVRSGGTGLGLAIAEAIVNAHHGEISVVSDLGRGTRFTVHLPAT